MVLNNTEIVPDCKRATLRAVIRGIVSLQSVIHSDGFSGYDGLVDMGYAKHFRVNHVNGGAKRDRRGGVKRDHSVLGVCPRSPRECPARRGVPFRLTRRRGWQAHAQHFYQRAVQGG